MSNLPDNFNDEVFERRWGAGDNIIVDDAGFRAEYAVYLRNKSNPRILFEEWFNEKRKALLNNKQE